MVAMSTGLDKLTADAAANLGNTVMGIVEGSIDVARGAGAMLGNAAKGAGTPATKESSQNSMFAGLLPEGIVSGFQKAVLGKPEEQSTDQGFSKSVNPVSLPDGVFDHDPADPFVVPASARFGSVNRGFGVDGI